MNGKKYASTFVLRTFFHKCRNDAITFRSEAGSGSKEQRKNAKNFCFVQVIKLNLYRSQADPGVEGGGKV